MKKNKSSWLLSFFSDIKLYLLICGSIMFFLGVALASYLSYSIKFGVVVSGFVCIFIIQLLEILIGLYIKQVRNTEAKTLVDKKRIGRHQLITLASIALALVIITSLNFLIARTANLSLENWILLSVFFILSIVKAMPFFRVKYNAYHGMIEGIIVVGLIPSLSFSFLTGELHNFLLMISLPLLFIYLASMLALAFSGFAGDVAKGRNTILVILGWQRGAFLHGFFILLGFCMLALSSLVGLPWLVTWPALIALPVGIFEIWQLFRLSQGYKPNWKLLKVTAISLFIFPVYLLIFTLFTR